MAECTETHLQQLIISQFYGGAPEPPLYGKSKRRGKRVLGRETSAWKLIGVATGASGGSCPPTVSRPGPEIVANSLRNFFRERGRWGQGQFAWKYLPKTASRSSWKCSRRRLAAGLAQTHWGSLSAPPDSLAAMRGPTCKGEGREEKEGAVSYTHLTLPTIYSV